MKVERSQFEKYAEVDPRLYELEERVMKEQLKTNNYDDGYCANKAWYGRKGLKSELIKLVGFYAEKSELRSCNAYDDVYQYLYNLLPECTHENCIC